MAVNKFDLEDTARLIRNVFVARGYLPDVIVMSQKMAHELGVKQVTDPEGNVYRWNDEDQCFVTDFELTTDVRRDNA